MRLLKIIFLLSFPLVSFNQSSFDLSISSPEDQEVFDIIQDSNGCYIVVGKIHNPLRNASDGYILKLDSIGGVIAEETISFPDRSCVFYNIHIVNQNYAIIGDLLIDSTSYKDQLLIQTYSHDFALINQSFISAPNDRWIVYLKSIIDTDSNIAITGYSLRFDKKNYISSFNFDPFYAKASITGDSISSWFMSSTNSFSLSTSILEKPDSTGYYTYGNEIAPMTQSGQRLELMKNLDSVGIEIVPYFIYGYISSIPINDSMYLISGEGGPPGSTPDYSLNVLTHNLEMDPIDYNYFRIGGNMRDHPAYLNSLSQAGDNKFLGGTSNFDYSNPYYSSLDSWFHLVKLYDDLLPIWEYWYGGDAYYHMYNLEATSDGGCVMVGTRYDDQTQSLERDIYILKVNSDGLLVRINEPPTIKLAEAIIFPNPGSDQINVKIAYQHKDCLFRLFDITGKIVLSEKLHGQWGEINTSSLRPGTYIYEIFNSEGLNESGTWIKR